MQADQVVQVLLRERTRVAVVATAIVRDVHAADDIFQQIVLKGLENPSQFSDAEHLLAWAATGITCLLGLRQKSWGGIWLPMR